MSPNFFLFFSTPFNRRGRSAAFAFVFFLYFVIVLRADNNAEEPEKKTERKLRGESLGRRRRNEPNVGVGGVSKTDRRRRRWRQNARFTTPSARPTAAELRSVEIAERGNGRNVANGNELSRFPPPQSIFVRPSAGVVTRDKTVVWTI